MQRKNKKTFAPKKPVAGLAYPVRLNKYIAHAGICSRRDADELILSGKIKINDKVVIELGTKIEKSDSVKFRGKLISPQNFVYILLNKPKDYITTMDDPQKRKTVMDLISNACDERVFPVGRLDRNTTGLLFLTNDGELTQKLTHPSYQIKKIYQIELDKGLKREDLDAISEGIELDDGLVNVDEISILDASRKSIGLEIHIGKNRVVRRIFEHLGYQVEKLDRTMYGSLTKKELPKGKWRKLSDREVVVLKNLS